MQENKRELTPEEVEKYRRKLRENDIRYNTDCEVIDGPIYDITQGQETIVKRVPSGVGHWLKLEALSISAY
jgi:hypothetical protein